MFALRPKAAVLAGAVAIALSLFSPGKSAHACSYNPFIGAVCLLASNSVPNNYLRAQGQLLQITAYPELFALIGTIYGSSDEGRTDFALPDLRGRVPIGYGTGTGLSHYSIGQRGGAEAVTQTVGEIANHTHVATATAHAQSATATTTVPGNNVWADARNDAYSTAAPNVDMLAGAVTASIASTGGTQSMLNMQPYLTLNWIIAVHGTVP